MKTVFLVLAFFATANAVQLKVRGMFISFFGQSGTNNYYNLQSVSRTFQLLMLQLVSKICWLKLILIQSSNNWMLILSLSGPQENWTLVLFLATSIPSNK